MSDTATAASRPCCVRKAGTWGRDASRVLGDPEATHSPIILTYPGAIILSIVNGELATVSLEETDHYQITKGILDHPNQYWQHLLREEE